jgi:hypothetical protein
LEAEYRDVYPSRNFNNVRCFKTTKTKGQKALLQWQVSLRDAGKQWTWDSKQAPIK